MNPRIRLAFLVASWLTWTSAAPAAPAPGVALVELFTSEGCSSCPPADGLLARVQRDAARDGRRVYGLAFHVDYWDHLGWRDRFSSPAFTRRQNAYARRFALAGPYTPQMVVNGAQEFVGSDAARASRAIADGLAHATHVTVGLRAAARGDSIDVAYTLDGSPKGAVLCVAWVDASASSNPDRGENSGRALAHVDVVRDFRSLVPGANRAGTLRLRRPEPAEGRVVAWVQDGDTGPVLGASATPSIAK